MERSFSGDFKVLLELEGEKRISGNDLFNLLGNILEYGSISRAAARMGISYRYAWGMVGAAEKALRLELVHRQAGGPEGGGTVLSAEGRELLEQYRSFQREVERRLEDFMGRAATRRDWGGSDVTTADGAGVEQHLLLASTMEPVETGLLDVLEEAFFRSSGILLRHIALGSGRALELARRGRVDMALTHAPELEEDFMRQGFGVAAIPVISNAFVLVGPAADPAGIKKGGRPGAMREAFCAIASSGAPFVSRGDRSGTHLKELQIWEGAGIQPAGDWYLVSSGIAGNMGLLRLAREKGAYTLVDRATFLLSRSQGEMEIFLGREEEAEEEGELENVFSLLLVNPQRLPTVNFRGALVFARWIKGTEATKIIESFGRENFGQPLFFEANKPCAPPGSLWCAGPGGR